MNYDESPEQPEIERSMQRSFLQALTWIIVGWSLASGILWFMIGHRDTGLFTDALVIAVGSGVIACVALIPGMLIRMIVRNGEAKCQSAELWGRLAAALLAGMVIRSVGTVALFLTYRYQLASSTEMIAGMTLSWYVYLTSIEVFVLARSLPKSAKPSGRKASIHVDTSMPVKV